MAPQILATSHAGAQTTFEVVLTAGIEEYGTSGVGGAVQIQEISDSGAAMFANTTFSFAGGGIPSLGQSWQLLGIPEGCTLTDATARFSQDLVEVVSTGIIAQAQGLGFVSGFSGSPTVGEEVGFRLVFSCVGSPPSGTADPS